MTYEEWCENSKSILAKAEEYNTWARAATNNLLTNIGPRIAKLKKTGYLGCGFHYSIEQSFGRLINELALPWQPCANHCGKVKDEMIKTTLNKVIYNGLVSQVEKAEQSLKR